MATLVATPGAATANSYATVAEGDDYHSRRLFATAWTGASTPNKEAALMMATRLIDAYFAWADANVAIGEDDEYYMWTGEAVDDVQALAWPRSGMFTRNGVAIAETVIPQELKDATSELARLLIIADRTLETDAEIQGLKSLKAGSVAVEFREGFKSLVHAIPPSALMLLVPSWYERVMADVDVPLRVFS